MSWKDKVDKHCEEAAPTQRLSDEKLLELINELEDYETTWSKWESDFITNISDLLNRELFITDYQCDKLEEIHEKYLNE